MSNCIKLARVPKELNLHIGIVRNGKVLNWYLIANRKGKVKVQVHPINLNVTASVGLIPALRSLGLKTDACAIGTMLMNLRCLFLEGKNRPEVTTVEGTDVKEWDHLVRIVSVYENEVE